MFEKDVAPSTMAIVAERQPAETRRGRWPLFVHALDPDRAAIGMNVSSGDIPSKWRLLGRGLRQLSTVPARASGPDENHCQRALPDVSGNNRIEDHAAIPPA